MDDILAVYEEGKEAAALGLGFLLDNPYKRDTPQWHRWRDGYSDYKKEEVEKRPRPLLWRWIDAFRGK
jgi:hypothetical protein